MRAKPQWLDLKRYDFAKTLDARGWCDALTRRVRYRDLWERQPNEDDSPEEHALFQDRRADPETFFQDYLDDVLSLPPEPPAKVGNPKYSDSKLIYSVFERFVEASRAPIQEEPLMRFPSVAELTPDGALPINFEISNNTCKVIIDLEAARGDIMEDFKNWLLQQSEGPLRLSGPRGAQETYSQKSHGKRWHRYRILAVMDVDLWCMVFNEPKISDTCLADWLMPEEDQEEETDVLMKNWGRQARMARDHALSALDALNYVLSSRG
jgi:hypothetical protein